MKKKKKSLLSRVGGAIKGAAKAVGSAAAGLGKNLVGSLINATGRSTLPTPTKIAPPSPNVPVRDIGTGKVVTPNQLITSATKSGDAKALSIALARYGSGFQTGTPQPTALTPGQFGGPTAAPVRTTSGSKTNLPKADAPTDASLVNPEVNALSLNQGSGGSSSSFSSGSSGTGTGIMGSGTANAMAANTGLATEVKSAKQLAADQAKLDAAAAQKQGDSFLKNIFKEQEDITDDLADRREDLERQYKIEAKTEEINSLQKSLSDAEVQVANQVAASQDVLGSNNFINNQVQQIERNSAPLLNRLRADINFKTGILTQNEALIEKAMEQATQQSRDRVENLKWFYTEHYDKTISKLDKKYDDAMKLTIKEAEDEHDYQVKLAEWKRDTIIEYGLEGLTINDSEAVISRAAARNQKVKDAQSGGGNYSAGFANSKIESSVREDAVALLDEVDNGNMSIDKAYSKLRTLYSKSEASDEALKSLLGLGGGGSSGSIYGSNPISLKGAEAGLDTSGISADIYNMLFK